MIIGIELRAPGLAEVTVTPSWWQRLLRRRRASTWFAVRDRTGRWHRDHDGRSVPAVVAVVLDVFAGAKHGVAGVATVEENRR